MSGWEQPDMDDSVVVVARHHEVVTEHGSVVDGYADVVRRLVVDVGHAATSVE
jgi:hypothetical protein